MTQPETSDLARSNNPKITQTLSALVDTNQVSKQAFAYDAHFNQTDVYEYGFGAGAPGLLIRRNHTDYVTLNNGVNYAADTNIHIRSLPLRKQVFDAGGKKRAETFYEYDDYNPGGPHAALSDCPNISGHDGAFSSSYLMRGNVTKISRALLDINGGVTGWVNSHAQYDIAGNVVKAIDLNGNATQFDFRDNFGSPGDPAVQSSENPANNAPGELGGQMSYAFPFKITNALGHKAYTKYDYYLGRPALSEDANGVKSNTYFSDALDRPTKGARAIGTSAASQTVFVYNDSASPVNGHPARSITTISDKDVFGESDGDNGLKSVALYDELGRMWRGAACEGDTWTITDTQFDALGRVSQVSNPYRADDPDSALPPANLWTKTEYDALGRPIKITTPDSAHVDTSYSGNQTTVTDQAGKKRQSKTDALGRLVEVIEDPGGLGYMTSYLYDALDNLRKVTQGEQKRWFAYDSLSRLIRAKNPEQADNSALTYTDPVTDHNGWSMAYSYDTNGNLVSKTDARNITTNYAYDALNRNTSVNYSNTTALNPDITNAYDNTNPGAYGKGRLWSNYARGDLTNGTDTDQTVIDSYDALGRPLSVRQHFKVNGVWKPGVLVGYTASVTYDLAGNVKTMTYPSGRTVNYSYDDAGRLSSLTGKLGDGQLRTYSAITQYHPAGMIERETFGTQTSLYQKKRYNNRLQLGDLRLSAGSDALSYDRGALLFLHGPNAVANTDPFANDPTNNGNLVKQLYYVPIAGGGEAIPQADNYTYDALNRISGVVEPNVFTQTYGYDRWGNRWITSATGGVNSYNPTYDVGSNRIVGPGYDKAGNITSDVLTGGTMTYDAQNRLLTATAGGGGTYTYDAGGKRTRRTAGAQETWHIYGVGGELLAEYDADGAPSAPRKEYGYRGGQILIIAESGSSGGVSFVKPALKSSADLIGKSGPEADGAEDGLFVDDEAVADLEFNEDSGSTTADVSIDNNTGTLVDGVTGTTSGGYGSALSFNGHGGELLAEYPPPAAPSAPQKEYGYRGGRSIVTVQSGGVVNVNPTANQSPDPGLGGVGVNSPINLGHSSTTSSVSKDGVKGSGSQTKTCLWHSFSGVTGTKTRVTLKFDWTLNANISVSGDEAASADASYDFKIEYSLDNGSTWTVRRWFNDSVSISGGGSDGDGINTSGSESVDLPNPGAIDITQIRIRDRIFASASLRLSTNGSARGNATASVSGIRLEVELLDSTAPVITGVSSSAVTNNSAIISWNTNEAADSQVVYGSTQAYGQSTALNPALVTAHSQGLSDLTPGTLYYYRVKSRDAAGNLTTSAEFTLTTVPLDTTAPVISNVAAGVTTTTATITWTTNENSDSQVVYGPTQAYGQSTMLNPALVTAHSQGLSGLTPGTLYYYRVKSRDAAGNLATSAEFTFTTAQNGSAEIKWLVTDHLGSTRMVIDETGSLAGIKRHDYLPFGEELFAGVGIRSASLGYGADSTRQKFTSKERDAETGLDYFLARYFSSVQGRFTSPDEFKGGPDELWVLGSGDPEKQALVYADVTNPQSLNKYQYCFNNPLRYVDPDGHDPQDGGAGRAEERLTQAYLQGKISREEYEQKRQELFKAQAIGAGAGLAIIGAVYAGPSAWAAIGLWAARNPGKVEQIAAMLQESAGGPPGAVTGAVGGATKAELSIAQKLASEGKKVEILTPSNVARTADFLVNGVKVELKTLTEKATAGTLKNALAHAVGQGQGNVLIDARSTGVALGEAQKAAARVFGADSRLQVVRIIGKDFDTTIARQAQ